EEATHEQPVTVPMKRRSEWTAERASTVTPLASPAVRRRAREMHVDLHELQGSGPNGRITHGDVDVYLRSDVLPQSSRRAPGSHTTEIQMAGLRRRIAEKMVVSSSEIPHFTYVEEMDITELEALREHLNSRRT